MARSSFIGFPSLQFFWKLLGVAGCRGTGALQSTVKFSWTVVFFDWRVGYDEVNYAPRNTNDEFARLFDPTRQIHRGANRAACGSSGGWLRVAGFRAR